MISPRWKKVLSDIVSNKTRTLLVVVSIAVGVFAVGTTLTIQDVLAREMNRNWQASSPASARLGMQGFHQDFVNAIRQMPEIADAEGRSSVFTRVKVGDDWQFIEMFALDHFDEMRLSKIVPATVDRADWPPAKREIILGTNSPNFLKTQIGQNILVQMPNNKQYTMRVAGTAYNVDEGGGPFMFAATGFVSYDTWAWLDQGREFDSLLIRVADQADNRDHIQVVADAIKKRVENEGRQFFQANIPRQPDRHPANETVQGIVALMTVLGIASLIMSGFLVINTVSAVLAQHVRQIGLMKAIGARSGQLGRMYLVMVLAFGALSLLIAVPLGMAGSRLLVSYMGESLLNLRIASYWPPTSVFVLQAGIGLIAPIVAAVAPVLSGTRKTVREAISDYGIGQTRGNGKAGWLARLMGRVMSRPLLISLRNTFRRKGRLALTMITLVLGGAIFMGVMSARDGLNKTLDAALAYWDYDMDANLSRAYPAEQVEREALTVPGVTRVETWGFGNARRVNDDRTQSPEFVVAAPPGNTEMLKPIVLQGRWLALDDQDAIVLNTDVLRTMPDIEIGDVINFKINGQQRAAIKVVGIVQGVLNGPIGYMNRAGFSKVAQYGGKVSFLAIRTDTRDPQQQAAISRAVEERFKRASIQLSGTSLTSNTRTAINSQFNIVIYLLMAMAILLAVVGGLGLAGTMSINVMERTREIGVMRAIGASNGAIRTIVIVEGVLIGFLSWLLGAALAVPFSEGIRALLSSALQFEVLYAFSAPGLVIWLVTVVTIASLASILPAWNASRLTVREVLAYA